MVDVAIHAHVKIHACIGRRLTLSVGRLTVLHMHVATIVVLHEITLVLRLWSWYICVGVGVGDHRFDTSLVCTSRNTQVRKLNFKQECDRDR